MKKHRKIREFYSVLLDNYGAQKWWPAETRLECIIGAILTQNTSWKNVEKAISNLKNNSLINIDKLNTIPVNKLSNIIRPSGYYNVKAARLKNLIRFIIEDYGGKIEKMLNEETKILRDKLLRINGIGPETADTILLYALELRAFVIDKYSYRVLSRHSMIPENTTYDEMQQLIMDSIEEDIYIYNEFHALIVKVGKLHCGKTAKCGGCPLEYDLL
ncbi:MAG: endonuclease III domain-containing protein [Thermodesulfobacteriota bacterium]